ncbi:hypothetical protein ABPG72_009115 [Tetrahymena utriculariae]
MAFPQNVNSGVNGSRLIGSSSTQQQHLVQLNPQDFIQNCQVMQGQQQQRIINSGFDQTQQQFHNQMQHQQPIQQFFNQSNPSNAFQLNCTNHNYASQVIQQQQHAQLNQLHQQSPHQFQQHQIQTNMQMNQNKLGLQEDDMSGLNSNDLHAPLSGIQQSQLQHHKTYLSQIGHQQNSHLHNIPQQQFNNNNNTNLLSSTVNHQNGQQHSFIQQQQQQQQLHQQQQQVRYNLCNNQNGYQQATQINHLQQHSSPKQQSIQQHQIGLVQSIPQLDLKQVTGLVQMDEESSQVKQSVPTNSFLAPTNQIQRTAVQNLNNSSPTNCKNLQNNNNQNVVQANFNNIMQAKKAENSDEVLEQEQENKEVKEEVIPIKKGRGRPRKIVSDDSKIVVSAKAKTLTLSNESTTGQINTAVNSIHITGSSTEKRQTRSANRIGSSCSVQIGSTVKDSVQLTTCSKAKTDIESSSAITRGNGLGEKGTEIPEEQDSDQYIPTEEEMIQEQKRYEALQRKKYKEELKKKSQEQYSDDEDSEDSAIDEKNFVPNSAFLKQYRQRLIGRSSNSKIFELKESSTDENIGQVVKIVPHKMSNHHQIECRELRNEFRFLKKMDHPRIISLSNNSEFIRDRNFCGLLLPQAECNLMQFAKTQRHGKVSLAQMRIAFRQIAEAIQYLHDNYISHNDIKPDNMFVFSENDYKLADFGFAIDLPKPNSFKRNSRFSQTLRKQVKIEDLKKNWKQRCKQYVAPELIKLLNGKRPRTPSDEKACDVFALGVSFFIIIFYQLPFCGSALKTDQRYKHFFKGQNEKFWSQFKSMLTKFQQQENSYPEELKDLFNKVLEPEPTKRLTIEQVLEHPWLNH